MKTYNLEIGMANVFIGDVPDFAIDSMEKFIPPMLFSRADGSLYQRNALWELTTKMEEIASWGTGYGGIDSYINWYPRIARGDGALGKEKDLLKYSFLDREKRKAPKQYLMVAPKEYFKDKGNDVNFHGTSNCDPIVLYPVDGGYIIVTSW